MSLIFATQLTAIATAVLATFAIITAVVAYMAFRRQTQEVGILQQQMKEQQEVLAREARERHRAQASRVFISLDCGDENPARFNVANTSGQPVYDTEIRWRYRTARTPFIQHSRLGTILPGERPVIEASPHRNPPGQPPTRTTTSQSSYSAMPPALCGSGRWTAISASWEPRARVRRS